MGRGFRWPIFLLFVQVCFSAIAGGGLDVVAVSDSGK
jgi:hypothetical protein